MFWSDVNLALRTVRVTAKPDLVVYPKRCEEREFPAPVEVVDELEGHTRRPPPKLAAHFPSPADNREQHMLDHAKAVAGRAGIEPTKLNSTGNVPIDLRKRVCCVRASMCARSSTAWGIDHFRQPSVICHRSGCTWTWFRAPSHA